MMHFLVQKQRVDKIKQVAVFLHRRVIFYPKKTLWDIKKYNYYNGLILLSTICFGLVFLASASVYESQVQFGNSYTYFLRQCLAVFLGGIFFIVVYNTPMRFWYKTRYLILVLAFVLILLPFVQGLTVNGASRWIELFGLRLQVAEISRLFFFIFIATIASRMSDFSGSERIKRIVSIVVLLLAYVLILWAQPSYATSVVVLSVVASMLFIAGLSKKEVWAFAAALATVLFIGVYFARYRVQRIFAYFMPDSYADSFAYQALQAKAAISAGGVFGNGLGNSWYKIRTLPEAHNDFILAVVAEELGALAVLGFIALLFTLLSRLFLASKKMIAYNNFAAFVGIALILNLFANSLINFGFSTNLLPVTGLPFPLLSYGGSFMLSVFFCLGIAFRIECEYKKTQAK